MPLTFDFTENDFLGYKERQRKYAVDNHPLRDTASEDFFDAMMSDEANLKKHGFISAETLKLLGE